MIYVKGEPAGKVIIQLAPTGIIPTKEDNPHVPITPEEIAKDTYEAYKLGASVVHVHARDEKGRPTYRKEIYSDIFYRIRERCPDIIICASTSGRSDPDVRHRMDVLKLKPEMASLTMGSVNFQKDPSVNTMEIIMALVKSMNEQGIKPELEIFEPGFINNAKYLVKNRCLKTPLHFNLLFGSLGSITADIRDLEYMVASLPEGCTWSAAGIGRFQMQIAAAATLMGGHVRIGLEDSIYLNYESKEPATNLELVKRVVRIVNDLGRSIASPVEARKILGLDRKDNV